MAWGLAWQAFKCLNQCDCTALAGSLLWWNQVTRTIIQDRHTHTAKQAHLLCHEVTDTQTDTDTAFYCEEQKKKRRRFCRSSLDLCRLLLLLAADCLFWHQHIIGNNKSISDQSRVRLTIKLLCFLIQFFVSKQHYKCKVTFQWVAQTELSFDGLAELLRSLASF